jgi:transglutaminase/protease-like cytokinesis protein 3
VARYIASQESDAFLRVKALHDFVADHVAYDVEAYERYQHGQPIGDEAADAEQVFARKKGVCSGYAHLLEALARHTGDEVLYAVGDARGSSEVPMPHAWNVAKIAGRYYLVDATWDAGSVGKQGFEKEYRTGYLFTPAEVFGYDHLPDLEWQQFTSKPIDRGTFMRRPRLRPEFFAAGLELVEPTRSQLEVANPATLKLRNPRGARVSLGYSLPNTYSSKPCGGELARGDVLSCQLPSSGIYDLAMFVNSDFAGSVQVIVR